MGAGYSPSVVEETHSWYMDLSPPSCKSSLQAEAGREMLNTEGATHLALSSCHMAWSEVVRISVLFLQIRQDSSKIRVWSRPNQPYFCVQYLQSLLSFGSALSDHDKILACSLAGRTRLHKALWWSTWHLEDFCNSSQGEGSPSFNSLLQALHGFLSSSGLILLMLCFAYSIGSLFYLNVQLGDTEEMLCISALTTVVLKGLGELCSLWACGEAELEGLIAPCLFLAVKLSL